MELFQSKHLGKPYICPSCNHGYTEKANMIKHYRHECGLPPKYKCRYCDYVSKYSPNIYTHIRRRHPDMEIECIKRY